MKNVIFVCTGNTCRSPMAEALLRRALEVRGIDGITVSSAGVYAHPGARPSGESIDQMDVRGIDIRGHRSRSIMTVPLDGALVLGMTEGHVAAARPFAPSAQTIMGYAGAGGQIDDPFGRGAPAYARCADQIEQAIELIADKLKGEM